MKILFLVGRELSYQRNDVLLRAFQRLGNVEIAVDSDKLPRSILLRSLFVSIRSIPNLLFGSYDLIFVGFYGHLLMLPVGVLARLRRIPILFDVFVSNYDTLAQDRRTISRYSLAARLAIWLDRAACRLACRLLADTRYHADYFVQTFNLPDDRFSVLPVGCNEDIFCPRPVTSSSVGKTNVLYYCTYQPLHGAHIIVQAAKQLQNEKIFFHLIGTGQEYPRVWQLAETYKLENIQFTSFVPLDTLREEINRADICLGGHFGTSDKANRVVPGKIYQLMAMERPIIAADTRANRDLLTHNKSAFLVPPDDPLSLARAIRTLHGDSALRQRLARSGYNAYQKCCNEALITSKLETILNQMR